MSKDCYWQYTILVLYAVSTRHQGDQARHAGRQHWTPESGLSGLNILTGPSGCRGQPAREHLKMKTPGTHDPLLNARAEAAARLYSFIASLVVSPMDARDLAALVDRIHDLSSGEERAFSFAITGNNRTCYIK